MVAEAFGTSPAAYTKDSDAVHVYRHNPQSTLPSGGPFTQLASAIVAADSNIPIQANLDAFSVGDLCAIYVDGCLLYTSPSPRDATLSRMPSSA